MRRIPRKILENIHHPARGTLLMDFEFIETLLELPEFRVIGQVLRPRELELHLERRVSYLICPHCQGCCARIKEGRDRCLRDLPMLDRPGIGHMKVYIFGKPYPHTLHIAFKANKTRAETPRSSKGSC